MANTYLQIYLHLIFAVKNRDALIPPQWQPRIHAYAAEMLRNRGNLPIAVGGTDNHIHIFFQYSGKELISELVRDLKVFLTKAINDNRMTPFKFEWQKGYGCFSHSHAQVESVKQYVLNQPQHHHNRTLQEEIEIILRRQGIEFDEKFIFTDPM
ncbi:MAG: transposase [Muribaculaceae bacterium]|nr:transposase [Muribaculaceae bacterium]